MDKQYYVYIMTNQWNNVFYTGVTNDLSKRVAQHKEKPIKGFTRRYNVNKLVYFEIFNDIQNALAREKQIKAGSRQKKIELIKSINNKYTDLYKQLI